MKHEEDDLSHLVKDDGTSLHDSLHQNFEKVYNSMQEHHGVYESRDSTLQDEKDKYGDSHKQMGVTEHSDPTQSVRKQETKMGDINNLQIKQTNQVNDNEEGKSQLSSQHEVLIETAGETDELREKQRQENQELMKKVDIKKLIKQYKAKGDTTENKTVVAAAKTALKKDKVNKVDAKVKPKAKAKQAILSEETEDLIAEAESALKTTGISSASNTLKPN